MEEMLITYAPQEKLNVTHRCIRLSGIRGKGKVAVISPEDFARVKQYKWHLDMNGYARCSWKHDGKRTTLCLHDFLITCPPDCRTEHINNDRLDNRRCNLRVVPKTNTNKNTSRYRGVCLKRNAVSRPWAAQITYKRKTLSLGYYATEEEAARAYDAKARELKGIRAKLNFPANTHHGEALRLPPQTKVGAHTEEISVCTTRVPKTTSS
jgi:hypothetical protein